MTTVQGRILILLVSLATLFGCSTVDLNQAALCEEVAKILFAGSDVDKLASATDPTAAHAVVTSIALRVANGADIRHRVSCGFESSKETPATRLVR